MLVAACVRRRHDLVSCTKRRGRCAVTSSPRSGKTHRIAACVIHVRVPDGAARRRRDGADSRRRFAEFDRIDELTGTLLGVAAAVVFGVLFIRGSVRINLQRFFRVTTVILYFVVFQLVVSGLHELSGERRSAVQHC